MCTATLPGPYALDVLVAQRVNGADSSTAFQVMLVLSSQLFGFAIAGLVRRILVWPSIMLWPGALVNCAVWSTLHKTYGRREKKHVSRLRFFGIALAAAFFYYFLPGYLFTALSVFNWACWIAPQNVLVNTLLGTQTGLGMSVLTFDWNQITWVGNPLISPVSSRPLIICNYPLKK